MGTVQQGTGMFTAICALAGTLVVIQLWLLSAGIDALYSGDEGTLWPAALASLVLFAANAVLLRQVFNLDRRLRADRSHE